MSRGVGDKVEEIQLNPIFIINHILISRVIRAIWKVIFAKGAEAKATQNCALLKQLLETPDIINP